MLLNEEEYFPRGGKKVDLVKKRPFQKTTLFEAPQQTKSKKRKVEKSIVSENQEDIWQSVDNRGSLNYKVIQDGMKVLGCIRKTTDCSFQVELPGLTYAQVDITSISSCLNNYLNESLKNNINFEPKSILSKIFQTGQYVPTKIMSCEEKLKASVNPNDVNEGRRHNSFKKGELVWAAIKSTLDHGYELDLGVKNCKIFLPFQNLDTAKEYVIGEPIWCIIHKVEDNNISTILRVSAKKVHINTVFTDESIIYNDLLPGMKLEVVIEKVLKFGIQCKFLDDYNGYINEAQLSTPLQRIQEIKEGSAMKAHILFLDQITKICHFTLRSIDCEFDPEFAIGSTISAKVICKSPRGLYVRLDKYNKGWISNNRLLKTIPKRQGGNFADKIKEKYRVGSSHHCVILNYNHMDRVYICSFEQNILEQQFHKFDDFHTGQLVDAIIHEVKEDGLVLKVGYIKGFVPNMHLSDIPFSHKLKKKFTVGQKVKAKVWKIKDENIIFTLKPAFVKNDICLCSVKDAIPNNVYPGMVLKAKPSKIIMVFYGDVNGVIPKNGFNFPITKEYVDNPSGYYFSGQVVNVSIMHTFNNVLQLNLNIGTQFPSINDAEAKAVTNIKVGDVVNGTITRIEENGLYLKVIGTENTGYMPLAHLSLHDSLGPSMLKIYKINDKINNLICLKNNNHMLILSRREYLGYDGYKWEIPVFEQLKKGDLIRCSVESVEVNGIYVSSPIINYNQNIFIYKKDFVMKNQNSPNFTNQQSIVAKVMSINYGNKRIKLTAKFDQVFDKNTDSTIKLFSQYLSDVELLISKGQENNWKFTDYKVGEKVDCTVQALAVGGGCSVNLPNGSIGLVAAYLCPQRIKQGDVIQGVVLDMDFTHKYLEICLRKDIVNQVNTKQDGFIKKKDINRFMVEKLLDKNNYVLGLLKNGKGQLVYLPVRLHENDSSSIKAAYEANRFKVEICGKHNNKLIGILRKLKYSLDIQHMKIVRLLEDIGTNENNYDGEIYQKNEKIEAKPGCSLQNAPEETIDIEEDETPKLEDDIDISESENDDRNIRDTELKTTQGLQTCEGKSSSNNNVSMETTMHMGKEKDRSIKPLPIVPSMSSYFQVPDSSKPVEDSSSDEESQKETNLRKKRKPTAAEKAEQLHADEAKIRKTEKELADPSFEPQSAEQFDRLVLANPNSSALWIKYISFHISSTELEKARAVGKRALEIVNMTLVEEKFNIWIALLNLENMYGSKDSVEKLFEDAVKYNDALKVYLKMIDIFCESGKHEEMGEKIKKVANKFKKDPVMWLSIAKAYYKAGILEEARNIKARAVMSILDPKRQTNLLIKLAILEFKHGDVDAGSAIFEAVLFPYPHLVNIWITYIDQLVKRNCITFARETFDRALSLKIPLTGLKTLYHKYRDFEEQHGSADSCKKVKQKLEEFMSQF